MTITKKKLIEVALPLDAINRAAQRERTIHTGLPSNLHTWWSRKPLGVARAIIFSSLVDDPGQSLSADQATAKRDELLQIVAKLADIENSFDKQLLERASSKIVESNVGKDLTFWDPFCGGGSLPLEALRLGLPVVASDINPVAVFISRVLVELAPRQAFHPPISSKECEELFRGNVRFGGLRRDVEYYAGIVHKRLEKAMEKYYPPANIPAQLGGGQGQVVSWIWARTVSCPNPSCIARSPLVNKFWLSTHTGNRAYVIPTYHEQSRRFKFSVAVDVSRAMALSADRVPFVLHVVALYRSSMLGQKVPQVELDTT